MICCGINREADLGPKFCSQELWGGSWGFWVLRNRQDETWLSPSPLLSSYSLASWAEAPDYFTRLLRVVLWRSVL